MNFFIQILLFSFLLGIRSFTNRFYVKQYKYRLTLLNCETNIANNNDNNHLTCDCNLDNNHTCKEQKEINDQYQTLMNQCCGEVNETDELEQLERDFFDIYQRMKKYNKKRIVKTTQELYKLFKKK